VRCRELFGLKQIVVRAAVFLVCFISTRFEVVEALLRGEEITDIADVFP